MIDTSSANSLISDGVIQSGGAGLSVIGFCWLAYNTARRRFEKNEKDIQETQLNLEKHKTYSEGVYAKSTTIERVHERIDSMSKKQDDMFQFLVNKLGQK